MRISLDLDGLDISLALRPDALHISEPTGGGVVVPLHEIGPLLHNLKLAESLYEVSTPLCGLGAEPPDLADLTDLTDLADLRGGRPATSEEPPALAAEPVPAPSPDTERSAEPVAKAERPSLEAKAPVAPAAQETASKGSPEAKAPPKQATPRKPAAEPETIERPRKSAGPAGPAAVVPAKAEPPKAEPPKRVEAPATQPVGEKAPSADDLADDLEDETPTEKRSRSRRARRRRAREAAAARAQTEAPSRPAPREPKPFGGGRTKEPQVVSLTDEAATFRIRPTVRLRRRHAEPEPKYGSRSFDSARSPSAFATPPVPPPPEAAPRPPRSIPALPRKAGSRTPPPLTEALAHFLTYNGPAPLDDLVRYVRTLRLWPAMNLRLSVTVALGKKSCGFVRLDDGNYALESDGATS